VLDWTSLYWLFSQDYIIYPPLWHSHHRSFNDSWKRQQGSYDSNISCIDLLVEIANERINLSICSIKYSKSVWRINFTAGLTPQGCSFWAAATTPWWWTEGLKFDFSFVFQLPCKGFDVFFFKLERLLCALFLQIRRFHFKAGLTPQDVLYINNYPRSYSLNDSHKLFEEISLLRSSNNHICLWMPILTSSVSCWSDAQHFLLKVLLRRRICKRALRFCLEHPKQHFHTACDTDRQRYPGSSKMASLCWIYSDVFHLCQWLFCFATIGQDFFLFFSHSVIPKM